VSNTGYVSGYSDVQTVPAGDATNTRFVLPKFATESESTCPVASVTISDSDTVATQSSSFLTPVYDATLSCYTSKPTDINTIAQYEFYVWATTSGSALEVTTKLTLNVGCSSSSVTFSVGSFPGTYTT